jgi:subtilisin family serine protease
MAPVKQRAPTRFLLKMGAGGCLLLFSIILLNPDWGFGASTTAANPQDYRADQILVQPLPGVSPNALSRFHAQHHTRLLRALGSSEGLQVIAVPPGETVSGLVEKYRLSGLVRFAEPDYIRHTTLTAPNDPKYLDGTLWALNNYGQNNGTAHADIDALDAWAVLASASNIVVAVLDTGIRYTHEDLAANMWVNPVDGSHGINTITNSNDPNDDEGHGTLMAGVIGGVGNNGKGVAGVAWKVQLMACKCFDSSGASKDSEIVAAIDFARENGARIISASFDSTNFGVALSNAVYRASQAGIIFVSSCGNNYSDIDVTPHYPACFGIDNIISVAYTTRNDALGQYSNYGATNVDLAAPGAAIYSCFFISDNYYLGAESLQGTSFAAAYVSGALALVLAKYPNEPYQQTIARILNGTDPLPSLQGKCVTGGRLNLLNALIPTVRLTTVPAAIPGFPQFRVIFAPARACVVQSSSDLASWTPMLTNLTSSAGTFDFSDLPLTNSTRRFYRAVSFP